MTRARRAAVEGCLVVAVGRKEAVIAMEAIFRELEKLGLERLLVVERVVEGERGYSYVWECGEVIEGSCSFFH